MEWVVRKFSSFAEAEAAEIEDDRNMTPQFRVEIWMELRNRFNRNAFEQPFERVCRIVKREQH